MRKIFLVTEFFHPNQNTTGYLFHKLHTHLKSVYGNNLYLIVKKDSNNEIVDSNIITVHDIQLNKKKLIQRLIFELTISLCFFWKILRNIKRNDMVFSGTTPIFLLPIIFLLKKIIGFKWVLLVHDVFPENLIVTKILKKENLTYKILKFFFDIFYAEPEHLIVIGQDMKELIDNKTHRLNSVVIQNWINENDIKLSEKHNNKILKKLNWQNETPVFQFFGNIGRVQGIDKIIEALALIEPYQRPKFIFIGDGAYVTQLKNSLARLNDPNVVYWGSVEQKERSIGLNACDIAVVTLAEGMLGLGVPSKAYYSMAANKPLFAIMDECSEVACMIKQHNIGWVVPTGDAKELASKIIEIVKDIKCTKLNSPREILIKNYSESYAMQRITEVLQNVCNK